MGNKLINQWGLLLGAAALGAGALYFLDPAAGRGRRARIWEKGIHARNVAVRYTDKRLRHLRNRMIGLGHEFGILAA